MFEGFSPEDFEAYLPEKWGSNVFTLPRRRVKEKLDALGDALGSELETAGLSVTKRLSDEYPSLWNKKKVDTQWLFFSRDEGALEEIGEIIDKEKTLAATLADPTPLYRHLFLGVALDAERLEVGLRLHHDGWVDRRNLMTLLGDPDGRQRFADLASDLPDHYEVGLVGGETASPSDLDEESVGEIVERFGRERGWLFVGARLPADQVPVLGPDVEGVAREAFRLLVPVYRFAAWTPDNDAISMDELVAERQEEIRATQAELDRERADLDRRRREREQEGLKLREEIEDRVRQTEAWRDRERAARRAAARALAEREEARREARAAADSLFSSGPSKERAADGPEADAPTAGAVREGPDRAAPSGEDRPAAGESRAEPEPAISAERMADLRIGDGVEVLRGFLAGRNGVVRELYEKAEIRVSFGALSSRLRREDVRGLGPAPQRSGGGRRRGR